MINLFEKLEEIKSLLPEESPEEVVEEVTEKAEEEEFSEDKEIFKYIRSYITEGAELIKEPTFLHILCAIKTIYKKNNHNVEIMEETVQYMGGYSIEIDGENFFFYDTTDGGFFPSWGDTPSITIIKNKKIIKNIIDYIFESDKNFNPDEMREKFNLI